MGKQQILFIINPISGGKAKAKIPALIDRWLDKERYAANFSFTEYVGHGAELAEEAAKKDFDVIVAVGGDGTINEVAGKVMQYGKTLAVIPLGSGNGLARFLKIPRDVKRAIQLINKGHVSAMDAAKLNDRYFFNVAGMGFDAHLSHVFASHKTRGLKGYVKIGLREIVSYKSQCYHITIDGALHTRDAFAVSVANSSQYGNNVYISPRSSVNDGLLEICIIKPFPLYKLPLLAFQMIKGSTHQGAMVEIISGRNIHIVRQTADPIHIDGESVTTAKDIAIEVLPNALKVLV